MKIPISRRGGIGLEAIRRSMRAMSGEQRPLYFITASSLSAEVVSSLFEEIVLTPEEDLVTEAMRIIEPSIERIASMGSQKYPSLSQFNSTRGGILVRMGGIKDRVPIGSMGDGIWRLLGLGISAVQSRNGILLVDEIDTGLHHTVMKDMWRFLFQCPTATTSR